VLSSRVAVPPFHPQRNWPTRHDPFFFMHLAKCAGTSLRYFLNNRTRGVLAPESVCIPVYTHSYLVQTIRGCKYSVEADARPAVMAGHFTWEDLEWMQRNNGAPRVCVHLGA
jgi:hypothetical protein